MVKRRILFSGLTIAAVAFLVFTIWIIREANIGRDNILFQTVRATPYGDKIGHVLLAGLLTLVANFLFRHRAFQRRFLILPYGSSVVLAIAIIEESSQYYLPTRSFDIMDALANLAGIFVFSIPALIIAKRRKT